MLFMQRNNENKQLKDLLELIQEPEFNRYDFFSRYLVARSDLLNDTCMHGINTIHFGTSYISDTHLQYAVANFFSVDGCRHH